MEWIITELSGNAYGRTEIKKSLRDMQGRAAARKLVVVWEAFWGLFGIVAFPDSQKETASMKASCDEQNPETSQRLNISERD